MEDLGSLPGFSNSSARAVNADGLIVVGTPAFRWTAAGGMENLGSAVPFATSADGDVIAGFMWSDTAVYSAARWTASEGWVSLPPVSDYDEVSLAAGISADGERLVGYSGRSVCDLYGKECYWFSVATRWTGTGHGHDILPGGPTMSTATAISADGNVVVGARAATAGVPYYAPEMIAFRRSFSGGSIDDDLGTLAGHSSSMALAVSGDGAVVVGRSGYSLAFRWTSDEGMVDLNAYLPSLGIDLGGWQLTEAVGISADGGVIVGNGVHNGVNEGWVAVLTSLIPGDLNCDGQKNGLDVQGFLLALLDPAAYGSAFPTCSTALADTNSDGVVDIDDLVGFVDGLLGA
jgi:uncharacterized membrane protein